MACKTVELLPLTTDLPNRCKLRIPGSAEHGRHTAGANVRREKGNNPDRQLRSIRGYLRGEYEITDFKWRMLKSAIDKYQHQPKMISVIPEYIIQCLTDFDNTIVMKKKIKGKEKEFAKDLKKLGFKVRLYDTGDDHYVIENKKRFPNKPTLLEGCKVIID